ncbi:MAG: hypothetical protein KGP28_10445 [Bdellovibrionales bacterium]|nr:hypothetical protein [Bdellovibrionales bacterium]
MKGKDPWKLADALSSDARFRVLQVLSNLDEGLGLRALERATALSIRSVQVATAGLVRDGVLVREGTGIYVLNDETELGKRILRLFHFLRDERIRERSLNLGVRARRVVELCEEVAQFVNRNGT